MDYWIILYIIDWVLFAFVALTVLYMAVYAVASLFEKSSVLNKAKIQNRIVVLIPSYQQDDVIEHTVISILGQTYPQRMFDVVVISDHQREMTNMRLAQYPITLLTPDFAESTKAKSLQFAILNLPEFKIYDIALILDADNIVGQDFLTEVNDAFETAATKAIQLHRISRNRDTAAARMGSIFEEINNNIFRRGHIIMGVSAALAGSGTAYDFTWFKTNIMKVKTEGEDKELEALLLRQGYFIDYFDHILVYGEKQRTTTKMNEQRGRWATQQIHNFFRNIRFLPGAIFRKQYDWADKIVQWMLVPRTVLVGIILIMSLVLPFIYFTLVIKWWIVTVIWGLALAIATPNELVDKNWDNDFISLPMATASNIYRKVTGLFRRK